MIEKRKLITISISAAAVALAALCIAGFLKISMLDKQLKQSQSLVSKMVEEARRLKGERENVVKENEKLQADAVSYLGINTDLQKERDSMADKFKAAQKLIDDKEVELQRQQKALEDLEKDNSKTHKEQGEKLKAATAKLEEAQAALKKERGLYNYNLGVAYSQAKLFDDAVSAYEKSISFDPTNAECHYNLGLLYETYMGEAQKALAQYVKYLELNPDAQDKDDVLTKVKLLKSKASSAD